MEIIQAEKKDLAEIMKFYDIMCQVLGEKSFMPGGNKGGFPSETMVEEAIRTGSQFIGVEDGRIMAAVTREKTDGVIPPMAHTGIATFRHISRRNSTPRGLSPFLHSVENIWPAVI